MSKIPTAEEVAIKIFPGDEESGFSFQSFNKTSKSLIKKAMIEYAKIHVQAALQAAAEQAKINYHTYFFNENKEKCLFEVDTYVDEQSILNAYPDENIK